MTTKADGSYTLSVPCAALVEALAGREKLYEGSDSFDRLIGNLLSGLYQIEGCEFVLGDPQRGEGDKISFALREDLSGVFDRLAKSKGKD